jgi:NADH-quinone oxidoreductase subunit J
VVSSGTARWFGVMLAIAMAVELAWALTVSTTLGGDSPAGEPRASWSVAQIGQILFTEYAFAFEATSILILVAMVGAIALAGRHLTTKWPGREARESQWRR